MRGVFIPLSEIAADCERFADVKIVRLVMGEEETVSHVHVDRLTEYSALFRSVFTPHWKENVKREMNRRRAQDH